MGCSQGAERVRQDADDIAAMRLRELVGYVMARLLIDQVELWLWFGEWRARVAMNVGEAIDLRLFASHRMLQCNCLCSRLPCMTTAAGAARRKWQIEQYAATVLDAAGRSSEGRTSRWLGCSKWAFRKGDWRERLSSTRSTALTDFLLFAG